MSQKVVQYQAVLQLAQSAPQLYDMAQLHRQMLEVLGIKNAQKLVKLEDDNKPKDPITENMDVVRMKPLKAFAYQDHQAHIATHQAFMQDPMTAQMIGQNPLAQQMMAALQAHIAEHYAFSYRNMIEQQVGAPLPPPDAEEQLPEEFETALSRMVAQAAQQLLQQNQAAAAQQQAQQQAQDPILQMQMQELQIKQAEVQRKAQKDQTDAQLKMQQQALEQQRIASQERIAMEGIQSKEEIEGMKLGLGVAKDQEERASKEEMEGMRMGIQIAQSQQQKKGTE
jgi:hypothetical protein